jgi:ribosomal protein L14
MICVGTKVNIVDKSGGKSALVIRILRNFKIGYSGNIVVVVVKDAMPKRRKKKKFAKRGDIFPALVLTNSLPIHRPTHHYLRFGSNTVILLKKNENVPFSNRMVGPVPRELRYLGHARIMSMASNVF